MSTNNQFKITPSVSYVVPIKPQYWQFELIFWKIYPQIDMEAPEFKDFAKEMVDYIANYLENIRDRWVDSVKLSVMLWVNYKWLWTFLES